MTREEAIRDIEYMQTQLEIHKQPRSKCLDMAIKALETVEEFEKAHIIMGGRLNGRTYAYKCGLEEGKRKALEQEPTRKKGKWERGYSFPDGEYVKCTVCGEIIKCIYPMHYCPNCGAEMESEE